MDPYRSPSLGDHSHADATGGDGDLLPVLWIFWAVTTIRVITGFARGGVFDTELSVAVLIAILAPWPLLKASLPYSPRTR